MWHLSSKAFGFAALCQPASAAIPVEGWLSYGFYPDSSKANLVKQRMKLFDYPAGTVEKLQNAQSDSYWIVSDSTDDTAKQFGQHAGVEASYMGFSTSVEESTNHITTETYKQYRADKISWSRQFTATVGTPDPSKYLTPDAKAFISNEPVESIALQFGAFYAYSMELGGVLSSIFMQSRHESDVKDTFETEIKVGYKNLVGSASASAGIATSENSSHSDQKIRIVFHSEGGDSSHWLSNEDFDVKAQKWEESINEDNLAPLGYDLRPLWDVVGRVDPAKGDALREYLNKTWGQELMMAIDHDRDRAWAPECMAEPLVVGAVWRCGVDDEGQVKMTFSNEVGIERCEPKSMIKDFSVGITKTVNSVTAERPGEPGDGKCFSQEAVAKCCIVKPASAKWMKISLGAMPEPIPPYAANAVEAATIDAGDVCDLKMLHLVPKDGHVEDILDSFEEHCISETVPDTDAAAYSPEFCSQLRLMLQGDVVPHEPIEGGKGVAKLCAELQRLVQASADHLQPEAVEGLLVIEEEALSTQRLFARQNTQVLTTARSAETFSDLDLSLTGKPSPAPPPPAPTTPPPALVQLDFKFSDDVTLHGCTATARTLNSVNQFEIQWQPHLVRALKVGTQNYFSDASLEANCLVSGPDNMRCEYLEVGVDEECEFSNYKPFGTVTKEFDDRMIHGCTATSATGDVRFVITAASHSVTATKISAGDKCFPENVAQAWCCHSPAEAPTTEAPTTEAPTTEAPTTEAPTTEAPTTTLDPSESTTVDPVDPTTSPVEPTQDPSESTTVDPSGPTTQDPSESTTIDPSESTTMDPVEPTTAPADPTTQDPSESTTVDPAEPTTAPVEPTTQDPSESTTMDPKEPTTAPVEPTTQEPTESTTMDPTEPTTQDPSESTTIDPSESTTMDPTEPTTAPVEPTTQDPSASTTIAPSSTTTPWDPSKPSEKECRSCNTMCAPCKACVDSQEGECEKCWHCWDWDDDELEDTDEKMDKDCDALHKDHDWDDEEVRCLTNQVTKTGKDCRACWDDVTPSPPPPATTTTTTPPTPSPAPHPDFPGLKACRPCMTTCAPCRECADGPDGSFAYGSCEKCWHCWDWDDDKLEDKDEKMDKDCDALHKDHDWDDDEVRCLTNQVTKTGMDCRACWDVLGDTLFV